MTHETLPVLKSPSWSWPVSPTQTDTWSDCPRAYLYRYLRKEQEDRAQAHSSALGTEVHAGLSDRDALVSDEARQIADRVERFAARSGLKACRWDGVKWVLYDSFWQPEVPVRTTLGEQDWYGKIDQIVWSEELDGPCIIDYKTIGKTSSAPNVPMLDTQLSLYLRAARDTGMPVQYAGWLRVKAAVPTIEYTQKGAISWASSCDLETFLAALTATGAPATDFDRARRKFSTWDAFDPIFAPDELVDAILADARHAALAARSATVYPRNIRPKRCPLYCGYFAVCQRDLEQGT